MARKLSFSIGDALVRFGQIYQIFEIKPKQESEGSGDQVLYFKPYFSKKAGNDPVCSIPVSSLEKTSIRKPLSRQEILQLLKDLAHRPSQSPEVNLNEMSDQLNENDPYALVKIIKGLWLRVQEKNAQLNVTQKRLLQTAFERLVHEVAYSTQTKLDDAKTLVEQSLVELFPPRVQVRW